jgi:NitT/TauT family transport system substrate-binding protein
MKLEYGVPTDKEAFRIEYGVHRGFFRAEGLDVTVRVVFGGPEIVALYDGGKLKIGQLGSPPATTALANGAAFRIVGSCVRRRAVQYFVARPDVARWSDLRGGAVGVLSTGSCGYWFARMVLGRQGLDPDRDVRIASLGAGFADVVGRLAAGELQAAVVSEPNVSIGERRNALHVLKALTDPEFCPTMQWSVLVANSAFIEESPSTVSAVLRACRSTYRHTADNEDDFADFCWTRYGVEPEATLRAMARERPHLAYDCRLDMPGLQMAIELQHSLGAFDAPLRAEELVDLRFVPEN